jgi:hypothetical protein
LPRKRAAQIVPKQPPEMRGGDRARIQFDGEDTAAILRDDEIRMRKSRHAERRAFIRVGESVLTWDN